MADERHDGAWRKVAQATATAAASARLATFDDFSEIRYVQSSAFAVQGAGSYSDEEIEGFRSLVYTPAYSERLAELIRRERLFVVQHEASLAGTIAWSPSNDDTATARLRMLHVRPGFTGLGYGTLLLAHAEHAATKAGFREFSARATLNAAPFFVRRGYEVTSHGVRPLAGDLSLAVVFLRRIAGGA